MLCLQLLQFLSPLFRLRVLQQTRNGPRGHTRLVQRFDDAARWSEASHKIVALFRKFANRTDGGRLGRAGTAFTL